MKTFSRINFFICTAGLLAVTIFFSAILFLFVFPLVFGQQTLYFYSGYYPSNLIPPGALLLFSFVLFILLKQIYFVSKREILLIFLLCLGILIPITEFLFFTNSSLIILVARLLSFISKEFLFQISGLFIFTFAFYAVTIFLPISKASKLPAGTKIGAFNIFAAVFAILMFILSSNFGYQFLNSAYKASEIVINKNQQFIQEIRSLKNGVYEKCTSSFNSDFAYNSNSVCIHLTAIVEHDSAICEKIVQDEKFAEAFPQKLDYKKQCRNLAATSEGSLSKFGCTMESSYGCLWALAIYLQKAEYCDDLDELQRGSCLDFIIPATTQPGDRVFR